MQKHFLLKHLFTVFFVIFINSTAFGHEPIESIRQIPEKISFYQKENPTRHPMIFFDLDDTLIQSIHPDGWGSDKWFSAMYNYLKANKIKNPLDIIFGVVTFVNAFFAGQRQEQFIIRTEDVIPNILKSLETDGVPVFGLTARTFILKDFTQKYLNDWDIVFSRINETPNDVVINETTAWKAVYSNGTIFCSGNNKGQIILEFFEHLKINSKDLVVFAIDDQESNLDKIEDALKKQNIDCVCLHYKPTAQKSEYELDKTTLSWLNLIIKNNQEAS